MGKDSRKSSRGKFEAILALVAIIPDFVSKPIGWKLYSSLSDFYFYLCNYQNLAMDKLPHP